MKNELGVAVLTMAMEHEPDVHPEGALTDFYAYLPTHTYLYIPTRELWPASSVNAYIKTWPTGGDGKPLAPCKWIDTHRPVQQIVWHPGEAEIVEGKVIQVGGWATHPGARVFNLFKGPEHRQGDHTAAQPWTDHVHRVYPSDGGHIIKWLAHRIQHPGVKCNHALVLGGSQGIGKDTLLEPIKAAIGAWNWHDINPAQMVGRFNGWAKAVIVRVNEARDLGDVDRFSFYDHSKAYIAAPPDVIRVDEKHLREHYVANVLGLIVTTNHKNDGLYLPPDDRRHYVAWSEATRDQFDVDYWNALYTWFDKGGTGHVGAYLRSLDLTDFDPKAPPQKTPAFWCVVQAGEAPESGELRDVLDHMQNPAAVTVEGVVRAAEALRLFDLADELKDRKARRAVPHKMERVDYIPVRNPDANDGQFKVGGRRQTVYAHRTLPVSAQVRAARAVG